MTREEMVSVYVSDLAQWDIQGAVGRLLIDETDASRTFDWWKRATVSCTSTSAEEKGSRGRRLFKPISS
jgi:hypothetical protein